MRFLVEDRGVEVNQQDAKVGWTPLHRAARVAHYTHAPGIEVDASRIIAYWRCRL